MGISTDVVTLSYPSWYNAGIGWEFINLPLRRFVAQTKRRRCRHQTSLQIGTKRLRQTWLLFNMHSRRDFDHVQETRSLLNEQQQIGTCTIHIWPLVRSRNNATYSFLLGLMI